MVLEIIPVKNKKGEYNQQNDGKALINFVFGHYKSGATTISQKLNIPPLHYCVRECCDQALTCYNTHYHIHLPQRDL